MSSLESLTDYAITSLAEETPSYFHEHEKTLAKEIYDYSPGLVRKCKNDTLLNLSDETIAMEDRIGNVLDASCELNQEYFKAGVQFSALLIMQLSF